MQIWVSALACVPFVIKHILLQNFVSTPTQALLAFWIQLVQVKGMLHDVGGGVKVGCDNMSKTRAVKCWYQGC